MHGTQWVSLRGKKIYRYIFYIYKSYRVLCSFWIRMALCHCRHCIVLAGCLCSKCPMLTSGQCACHGVASFCIPFYCVSSCLRWNISMRDDSQRPTTYSRVAILLIVIIRKPYFPPHLLRASDALSEMYLFSSPIAHLLPVHVLFFPEGKHLLAFLFLWPVLMFPLSQRWKSLVLANSSFPQWAFARDKSKSTWKLTL